MIAAADSFDPAQLSAAALEVLKRMLAVDKGEGCHMGQERLRKGLTPLDRTFSDRQLRRHRRRLREVGAIHFGGFTANGRVVYLMPGRQYDPARVPIDPARGSHHLRRPEFGDLYNRSWDTERAEQLLTGQVVREPPILIWDGYEVNRRTRRDFPEPVIRQAIGIIKVKNKGDLSAVRNPSALLRYYCEAIMLGRRVERVVSKPPESRSPKEERQAQLNREEREQLAQLELSADPAVRRLAELSRKATAAAPAPPEEPRAPAPPAASLAAAPASAAAAGEHPLARLFAAGDAWLRSISHLHAETRDRYYPVKVKALRRGFGDLRLNDLDAEALRGYADARRAEGVCTKTIGQEFSTLALVVDHARRHGAVRRDLDTRPLQPPLRDTRPPPEKTYISREQFERLLGALPVDRRAWVELNTFLMCRPTELESLRLEDVRTSEEGWEILVRGTKNKYAHNTLPLVGRPLAIVQALQASGRTSGPLVESWTNIRRDLPLACDKAEIPHVNATDLRGCAMTWLVDEGVPVETVARMARHAGPAMVQGRYMRHCGKKLRRVAEQLAGTGRKSPPDTPGS